MTMTIPNTSLFTSMRCLRGWLAGPLLDAIHLEQREPTVLMSRSGVAGGSHQVRAGELVSFGSKSVEALSEALDRRALSRTVCVSLALVEHVLVAGTADPLTDL